MCDIDALFEQYKQDCNGELFQYKKGQKPMVNTFIKNPRLIKRLPGLVGRCSEIISESIADSTWNQYRLKVNRFIRWCYAIGQKITFPIDDELLLLYATWRAQFVSGDTVNGEISAIRTWQELLGVNQQERPKVFKRLVIGIKRISGVKTDNRLPFTYEIMCKLMKAISKGDYQDIVMSAAFSFAYFGLLRISEWTAPIMSRPPNGWDNLVIRLNNVTFHPSFRETEYLIFTLPGSKTDQFRQGFRITMICTKKDLCATCAIRRMLVHRFRSVSRILRRLSSNRSLFMLNKNQVLSEGKVRKYLREVCIRINLNSTRYLPQSFRIGGATNLLENGVSVDEIKLIGRWKSNAVERYLRFTLRHWQELSSKLAKKKS